MKKIFPVELWLSWAAAYSITQSVFPLLSVFLLILTFFLISTPWLIAVFHSHLSRLKRHISRPSTFNSLPHFPQSLCLLQWSIIVLSVVFICFLFPFFQLSLWLISPPNCNSPYHHSHLLLCSNPPPWTCVVRSDYRPLHCPRQVGLRH